MARPPITPAARAPAPATAEGWAPLGASVAEATALEAPLTTLEAPLETLLMLAPTPPVAEEAAEEAALEALEAELLAELEAAEVVAPPTV